MRYFKLLIRILTSNFIQFLNRLYNLLWSHSPFSIQRMILYLRVVMTLIPFLNFSLFLRPWPVPPCTFSFIQVFSRKSISITLHTLTLSLDSTELGFSCSSSSCTMNSFRIATKYKYSISVWSNHSFIRSRDRLLLIHCFCKNTSNSLFSWIINVPCSNSSSVRGKGRLRCRDEGITILIPHFPLIIWLVKNIYRNISNYTSLNSITCTTIYNIMITSIYVLSASLTLFYNTTNSKYSICLVCLHHISSDLNISLIS